MHPQHKILLEQIKNDVVHSKSQMPPNTDIASQRFLYHGSVPTRRKIAKAWLADHKDMSDAEFLAVLDSLYHGKSAEEKTIASYLLGYRKHSRTYVTVEDIDRWLEPMVGWCEVDTLCQNIFTAEELLADWTTWKAFLEQLSHDKNIQKRRASLVFLTQVVRKSDDIRLKNMAFRLIKRLQYEKDILITKAISWLLRDLTYRYKEEVMDYLERHEEALPKIAIRETWRKIKTGKK